MKRLLMGLCATLCALLASSQTWAVDCNALPEWNSTTAYTGNTQVKELSKAYKANWWSQGQSPATHSGQYQEWTLLGACDGSSATSSSKTSSSISSSSVSSVISSVKTSSSTVTSSSISSVGGICSSVQYAAGTSYVAGQLVQNLGSEYRCTIPGWCSSTSAWAYAPGSGSAWAQAWELVRACSVSSNSSNSSSVSSSVKSSSSSVVTSSSVGSSQSSVNNGLPKHALVGYWHNFDNGSGLLRVADVDNSWDVIVIAFADDAGNGSVKFVLDPALNKAQFIADVAAKRAAGKKVVLSFGGQNGTVTLNSAANVANFVSSTAAILNEYGFDGIDIDLESGASVSWGAPVISNLVAAVKQLKTSFPNLYLSMAPEHPYVQGGYIAASGIWGAYLPLIDGLRSELSILHVAVQQRWLGDALQQ